MYLGPCVFTWPSKKHQSSELRAHPNPVRMLNCFSRVWPFETLGLQPALSARFSRHECLSELPCPLPGDIPDPGIKPASLMSPALAGRFVTTSTTWEAQPMPSVGPLWWSSDWESALQCRSSEVYPRLGDWYPTCLRTRACTPQSWALELWGQSTTAGELRSERSLVRQQRSSMPQLRLEAAK